MNGYQRGRNAGYAEAERKYKSQIALLQAEVDQLPTKATTLTQQLAEAYPKIETDDGNPWLEHCEPR